MSSIIKASILNFLHHRFNHQIYAYQGDLVKRAQCGSVGQILFVMSDGKFFVDMGETFGMWKPEDCLLIVR